MGEEEGVGEGYERVFVGIEEPGSLSKMWNE